MKLHWPGTWIRISYPFREETEDGQPLVQVQIAIRDYRRRSTHSETVRMSSEAFTFLMKHATEIQAEMGKPIVGSEEPIVEMSAHTTNVRIRDTLGGRESKAPELGSGMARFLSGRAQGRW